MLREGDRLNIGEKITGHYTLEPVKPGDTVLFLGTGTGEAPHNYMLWELLRPGTPGKILSACCVRMPQDLGYLDIARATDARSIPNYTYLPLTTREAGHDRAQGLHPGPDHERAARTSTSASRSTRRRTHVFLCGNPKMIGVPVKDKETGAREYPQPPGVIEILEKPRLPGRQRGGEDRRATSTSRSTGDRRLPGRLRRIQIT